MSDQECDLIVNYNQQKPFCSSEYSNSNDCKSRSDLCQKDNAFALVLTEEIQANGSGLRIPLALKQSLGDNLSLLTADLDLDGFTDVLLNTGNEVITLQNVACTTDLCGTPATDAKRRTLIPWATFQHIAAAGDVASVVDIGDDGSNDLIIASGSKPPFVILNYLRPEADILKTTRDPHSFSVILPDSVVRRRSVCAKTHGDDPAGTDGQCFKLCDGKVKPVQKPYGSHSLGSLFKFVITDIESIGTSVTRVITHTLNTHLRVGSAPSDNLAVGLASSSSYIDALYFGCSLGSTSWTGVIPNSKLFAITEGKVSQWRLELYIEPGKYILWRLLVS